MSGATPFFSVVLPTLNRPSLLRRALNSIALQSCPDFEVIVVDDGSTGEALKAMRAMAGEYDSRFTFAWRETRSGARGPAGARNVGIRHATGSYVTFLDDDDYWTDATHLEVARRALTACPDADLYLADQIALRGETCVMPHWLPQLERVIRGRTCALQPDVYAVSHKDLLQPGGIGFAHVNITVAKRDTLARIGGFWEETAYEEDLEFFLRLADASDTILYRAAPVSVQTVRDANAISGASNLSEDSRLLFRMLDCQRVLLNCRRPEVLAYARLLLAGVLKTLARRCHRSGQPRLALEFGCQAASLDRGPKWLCIAAYLGLRAWLS
jgi:glycosyltransferase involved in cell wall biosynthesis